MRDITDARFGPERAVGKFARGLFAWRERIRARLPDHIPIAYKLALAITLLVVAGMALLGLTIVSNQTELMRAQMNDFGQTVVNQLADSAREPVLADDILGLRVLTSNLVGRESIKGAAIYSEAGQVLASSGVMPRENILQFYGRSQALHPTTHTFDWEWPQEVGGSAELISFLAPIRFENLIAGHALVTFTRDYMRQSSEDARRAVLWATLLMGALATLTAFIMSRRLSRPIHDLMDVSRAIHAGDYEGRLQGRRNDEIGFLMEGFDRLAKGLLEKSRVEAVLSRFVDHSVAAELLENLGEIRLGGKHVRASVLFADIVGFTRLSEKLPPSEVGALLNEYFAYVSRSSRVYHGTIDKFIGDCVMVVFGVPQEDAEHSLHAIACAVMIQRLMARLNARREPQGKLTVNFRIGVNCGDMLAGNLGSRDRMQYTVVGDAVNLASRLSSIAESGQIVVSEYIRRDPAVRGLVSMRPYAQARLRGKELPVATYLVEDIASAYREAMDADIQAVFSAEEAG
jgi:adenylate cyclase